MSLATISYMMTRSMKSAGIVAVSYTGLQIILYYLHEKIWDRVRWGRLKGVAVQFTGLSGAGKSTIAKALAQKMFRQGHDVEVIDGDDYRINLCSDLGFSREDRIENIRRLTFVAHKIAAKGKIAIVAAINPYEASRKFLGTHPGRHMAVFVDVPIEVAIERDTKGLYRKALLPPEDPEHVPQFTGISDPFDAPSSIDVYVNTHEMSLKECVDRVEREIKRRMK